MLAEAIKAQKAHLKNVEEFGESEDIIRREHEYLAWLEAKSAHEGEIELVLKEPAG